jgi:uncharacterized cupredoxin-like copper-binding protein
MSADFLQIKFPRRAWLGFALLLTGPALAHDHPHTSPAGQPGEASKPARTVEVTASDEGGRMAFTPARLDVAKGEQVRFNIRNAGALPHEFFIGTKAANVEHAKMMAEMPDMKHDDPNAVTIPAGQSASVVWRFTKAGAFEFACLISGHYESGMHGVVNVK